MAQAYSDDLRRKLLEAHEAGKGTLRELAEQFGVSRGWAWRVSAAHRRTGEAARPGYRLGRKTRVDHAIVEQLVKQYPDLFMRELAERFSDRTETSISMPHLWRLVQGMVSFSKKSIHAMDHDNEANRLRRERHIKRSVS